MATYCLTSTPLYSPSSPTPFKFKLNPTISSIHFPYRTQTYPANNRKVFTVSAIFENEQQQQQQQQFLSAPAGFGNGYSLQEDYEFRKSFKHYELYVCNLPRSCGITELLNKFEKYGVVQSVEVFFCLLTMCSMKCLNQFLIYYYEFFFRINYYLLRQAFGIRNSLLVLVLVFWVTFLLVHHLFDEMPQLVSI